MIEKLLPLNNSHKDYPRVSLLTIITISLLIAINVTIKEVSCEGQFLDDPTESLSLVRGKERRNFVPFNNNYNYNGPSPSGQMFALDRLGRKSVRLVPGLLDETLLNRGSFSFGSKLVYFDKLKVLGNVYVNKINGRPLRETYLLKSTLNSNNNNNSHKRDFDPTTRTTTFKSNKSSLSDDNNNKENQKQQLQLKTGSNGSLDRMRLQIVS